jgi:hypothetical protein
MDGCLWKQNDKHSDRTVREIWNKCGVVLRSEDVDRERSGTIEAWIITGSIREWHSMAGCEDRVADDGGNSGCVERRWNSK